jgi:hypothetical protein
MAYNYLEEVKKDVIQYIKDEIDLDEYESRDELEEELNYDLWDEDSVTGNGSGSYTFDREEAKKYVLDSEFDGLEDMISNFGIEAKELGEHLADSDWEWFDVSLRCYWLGQAIGEALDEVWDRE